jgi:hypothetical protein
MYALTLPIAGAADFGPRMPRVRRSAGSMMRAVKARGTSHLKRLPGLLELKDGDWKTGCEKPRRGEALAGVSLGKVPSTWALCKCILAKEEFWAPGPSEW